VAPLLRNHWHGHSEIARVLLSGKKALKKYIFAGAKSERYFVRETKEIILNEKRGLAWENGIWKGYDPRQSDESIVNGNYSAMWIKKFNIWKIKSQLFVTLGEK